MLHNLLFKAIFGQDYPNLGRLCNMLLAGTAISHRYHAVAKGLTTCPDDTHILHAVYFSITC